MDIQKFTPMSRVGLKLDTPIAVLLSGGVDSSVALARLVDAGFTNVRAYYLKIWLEDELSYLGSCPWEEDLSYAQSVCDQFSVPLEVVPMQQNYYDRVVSYTIAELKKGHTPSPDIFCNLRVKFGAFWDFIHDKADYIASGHYAQAVQTPSGLVELHRAPDPVKDQTYFLSHLSPQQMGRILFPLGDLTKPQVRALAEEKQLATMARKDSQGICFLGKIRYSEFVKYYLGEKEGAIVRYETGEVLGTHQGFWFHTIGQRSGLGLGNGPWYVTGKDCESNVVYVSHSEDVAMRVRTTLPLAEIHWIAGEAPSELIDSTIQVKLRHGPATVDATVTSFDPEADSLTIELAQGDRGAAPGQFAVLYRGENCLGGAKIQADPMVAGPVGVQGAEVAL